MRQKITPVELVCEICRCGRVLWMDNLKEIAKSKKAWEKAHAKCKRKKK